MNISHIVQFQFSAPRKFGCSIIPNCSEDIILACAFYPIEFVSLCKIKRIDGLRLNAFKFQFYLAISNCINTSLHNSATRYDFKLL